MPPIEFDIRSFSCPQLWVEVLLLKPACHEEEALRPKSGRSQLVKAGAPKYGLLVQVSHTRGAAR